MSVSHKLCSELGHKRTRHSPDGFNVIEECPECCMAWKIMGVTGEIIRLEASSYERRLAIQKFTAAQKSRHA